MEPQIKLEVGVKAFITNADGKYLVLRRSKPYPGLTETMWDIPGGRINPGETLKDALSREIFEETKMTMTDEPKIIYSQDILRVEGRHTVRLTYLANAEGEITLDQNEHTEYDWISLDELSNLYYDKYLEPVIPLLKKNEEIK